MNKRVVILAGAGESTNIVYHAIKEDFELAGVIIEKPVDQKTFIKRRIKNLGLIKVAGQILFKILILNKLEEKSRKRFAELIKLHNLNNSVIPESIIKRVPSVNSPECIEIIKKLKPAVIVVNGTRIIAKKVLNSVDAVFINMHAGITPLYRGVHGGYWALVNNDRENCGVTVHLVDAGIDTGNILYQAHINPTLEDNFSTYPLLQLQAGLSLLKQAVNDALTGNIKVQPNPKGVSKLWSHPTLTEYLRYRKKLGVK